MYSYTGGHDELLVTAISANTINENMLINPQHFIERQHTNVTPWWSCRHRRNCVITKSRLATKEQRGIEELIMILYLQHLRQSFMEII